MTDDELLGKLYDAVKAEPLVGGIPPPVANELLSVIQFVRSAAWTGLNRSRRRTLTQLLGQFNAAPPRSPEALNMSVMEALPGSASIVEALKKAGGATGLQTERIVKDEQIWIRLGDNKKGEVATLAAAIAVPQQKLLDALTNSTLSAAESTDPGFFRRHVMDGLVGIAIVVFFVMIVLLFLRGLPDRTAQQVVLKKDLTALMPITASDVGLETVPQKSGSFGSIAGVIGRYPSASLPRGAVPTSADLSLGKLAGPMTNRSIVRMILKPGKPPLPWNLPSTVVLLVTPRHNGGRSMKIDDAWILALQDNGDTSLAWVAVDKLLLDQLSATLGDADVFVARP